TMLLPAAPVGARHRVKADLGQPIPFLDDLEDLVAEPRIDASGLVDPLDRHEATERGFDLEDAFGRRNRGREHELVVAVAVELALGRIAVETETAGLERTHCFLQRLDERA